MATAGESAATYPIIKEPQCSKALIPILQDTSRCYMPDPGPKAVAVIGTTGFLGPHIVASLLRTHTGSKIFCINRSLDGEQRTMLALENISEDYGSSLSRLHFIVTDVTEPNMGLEQGGLLTSEIDEVIFNAWNPNWSLPLESFEPLLEATRSAIRFCTSSTRWPRITFVSSVCAIGEWPREHPEEPLIPEQVAWDSASAMAHGYGESKCIAEQLLARVHTASDLRVAIVRAGQIGGPAFSGTERSVWPIQGWVYLIIKASEKVGYWPAHVQSLDWIPVDALADGIARITRTRPSDQAMQVFNMVHPQPVPWRLLFTTLEGRFGLRAKEVSLPEWLDKLPETLKLYDFLRAAGQGRENNMTFRNESALQVLPELAPLTEDQLAAWLKGWDLNLGSLKARM